MRAAGRERALVVPMMTNVLDVDDLPANVTNRAVWDAERMSLSRCCAAG